jgi:hypothetical protein
VSYHATLGRLTDDVQAKVLTALRTWKSGRITRNQFVQIVAAHVAMGNARAIAVADYALASTLSVELGVVQPATGVTPPSGDAQRLAKGATTLALAAEAGEDVTDRLARLATAEPASAAADAWSDGMKRSKKVRGWVRQLDADPCQLCRWWWRDGQVWPADHPMPHHKGCTCTPKPVVTRKETK